MIIQTLEVLNVWYGCLLVHIHLQGDTTAIAAILFPLVQILLRPRIIGSEAPTKQNRLFQRRAICLPSLSLRLTFC